ncbi:MAG: hypothetical protein RIR39_1875, partial [Pseudomonadota bacterium]
MQNKLTTKIFVNSLPKSGTNMVQKCLELAGIPYSERSVAASSMFGRFARIKSLLRDVSIKETPVVVGLEIPVGVSPTWLHDYLKNALGYVSGHAAYSSHFHSILKTEGFKTIQVVRDPNAVLASWANYIAEPGYYWHDAQRIFARMNPQARVRLILHGGLLDKSDTRFYYRGFREVWNQVQGWVDSEDVLTVRYEDLVGHKGGGSEELQRDVIAKILRHVGIEVNAAEVNRIAENLYGGTHTFRQGSIEGWRKLIDADLEVQVSEQLHDLPVMKSLQYLENSADISTVHSDARKRSGDFPSTQASAKTLKVLLITEGYGQTFFGVAKVVEDLRRCMIGQGAVMKVAALVVGKNEVTQLDGSIVVIPHWKWTKTMRFHWRQSNALAAVVEDFQPDVIHVHGVLVPLQRAAVLCALKRKIPVAISVHGMLEPWLWRQRSLVHFWMKRFYWNAVMKPVLKNVNYVHVITKQEADTLSVEFPSAPQILIPNAIDLAEFNPQQTVPDEERYILFLGRIHPKKGIGLLISAFAELEANGCKLLIAGSDHSVEYTNELKEMVRSKNIQDRTF